MDFYIWSPNVIGKMELESVYNQKYSFLTILNLEELF